jgi:hypothetical protein
VSEALLALSLPSRKRSHIFVPSVWQSKSTAKSKIL